MAASNFIWQEMSGSVTSVAPQALVQEAVRAMRERGFHHLPVMDGTQLVGILSDRDLPKNGDALVVADIMTRNVRTCDQNDKIGDITDIMIEHRINCLPVLDSNKRIVGIITSTDLLKYLRRTHKQRHVEPFERVVIDLNDIADVED